MTAADARNIHRYAQRLVVEFKPGVGAPPSFGDVWHPLWGAKIDRIEINRDVKSSTAAIWFPDYRWNEDAGLVWGDMVRIRTDELAASDRTVLFVGFVTARLPAFSGGSEQSMSDGRGAKPYERCAFLCQDFRWLLASTSVITGQYARGRDDYDDWGLPTQHAISDECTWFGGRRTIFNADGKPNSDPIVYQLHDSSHNYLCDVPIFANPSTDPDVAIPWTARDMIHYILAMHNFAYQYLPIDDPGELVGLDDSDWDMVLNHIVVDGLNLMEAVHLICKHIGWGFRQENTNNGTVTLLFYKPGGAVEHVRDDEHPTILHRLHAPDVGEAITTPVAAGRKLLWSMELAEDIAGVVNAPWGLGSPQRFEFSAELVPAWPDEELVPDDSGGYANLFFTEAELGEMTSPNDKPYYRYYHARGDEFRRHVGRKWVLNETGRYSRSPYDRGMPFDFTSVIPAGYIYDSAGKRIYGPFNRRLLPCLTVDNEMVNSVGIILRFSFNGGAAWQVIPCAIIGLTEECGVWIREANLAEIIDQAQGTIAEGPLAGKALNLWTSLADDIVAGAIFKDGEWRTRLQVTASVQMDRRLAKVSPPSSASGSPFYHSAIYDFSEKWGLQKRSSASIFDGGSLSTADIDSSLYLARHIDAIRAENEDMSISGRFTLERLWLGDGRGVPDFMIGDGIERITGREYDLSISFGGGAVYPEVVQIVYLPDAQKMELITRDLRFVKMTL